MARRRTTASQAERARLTAEETNIAAQRMMAAAQAHQRAATWCMEKPDAKPPNIDTFFFLSVAFELVLLSLNSLCVFSYCFTIQSFGLAMICTPTTRMFGGKARAE